MARRRTEPPTLHPLRGDGWVLSSWAKPAFTARVNIGCTSQAGWRAVQNPNRASYAGWGCEAQEAAAAGCGYAKTTGRCVFLPLAQHPNRVSGGQPAQKRMTAPPFTLLSADDTLRPPNQTLDSDTQRARPPQGRGCPGVGHQFPFEGSCPACCPCCCSRPSVYQWYSARQPDDASDATRSTSSNGSASGGTDRDPADATILLLLLTPALPPTTERLRLLPCWPLCRNRTSASSVFVVYPEVIPAAPPPQCGFTRTSVAPARPRTAAVVARERARPTRWAAGAIRRKAALIDRRCARERTTRAAGPGMPRRAADAQLLTAP